MFAEDVVEIIRGHSRMSIPVSWFYGERAAFLEVIPEHGLINPGEIDVRTQIMSSQKAAFLAALDEGQMPPFDSAVYNTCN